MKKMNLVVIAVLSSSFALALAFAEEAPRLSGQLMRVTAADGSTETMREVHVVARKYKYEPTPIVVGKDEKVRLLITSADARHGFKIADFNVNENNITRGNESVVTFVADKAGTHTIKCSHLCGFGHPGMSGKLIVQ